MTDTAPLLQRPGKPPGLLDCLRWIGAVLAPEDRRHWRRLMLLSAAVGLFEALGVLSILPFLAVVSDPAMLERPGLVATLYARTGFEDPKGFQLALGFLVFFMLVTGIGLRMWRIVLNTRFARAQAVALSLSLLRSALNRPYGWFLQQHSAQISASILSEVERVVTGALASSVELVASAAILLAVLAMLFVADPTSALVITLTLGMAYGAVVLASKRYLRRLGKERVAANRRRFTVVGEVLGGIKEVKLLKIEDSFLSLFADEADKAARARALIRQISELPRSLLEVLVFGGMLGFVLFILARDRADLMAAIPIIGLFAFAGVRMFPVVQALYRSYSILLSDSPALEALRQELAGGPVQTPQSDPVEKLPLTESITLKDLRFSYADDTHAALSIDHAAIPAGVITAIAGPSGSGKSTLIDILLALLPPTGGAVLVDGAPLTPETHAAWQANLGYVPQHVYLMDDSIAANIAFGRDRPDRDARIRRAAEAAAIDGFIDGLAEGYDTRVGERGVRLSGGQAQRIAIARALYDDPQVLILDEPTSALDSATEQGILDGLMQNTARRTVLIVTHRDSTIATCDHVIRLAEGRLAPAPDTKDLKEEIST